MEIFSYDLREVKRVEKKADEIIDLEKQMSLLSDKELANKTLEFKKRLKNGETLDDILVEAFAVCREASFRVLGKKHYKVQLMGGIVIHQGRVAEMKTGEGKTLTELCPAYLNALAGKGVHVITVNDYLAKRDKEEMEGLFHFLNLTVGLVIESTDYRRAEYRKDITYTTNSEVGFDYLKDNLVKEPYEKVLRALNYAIIDEIDSILIDDAKTPLIISTTGDEPSDIYANVHKLVSRLKKTDYKIEKEENLIYLTEAGIGTVEKMLEVENLADIKLSEINHVIVQSLRANFILRKNKDYIIQGDEIILIDENTGRVSEGRRLSNGLHQCLEAKESLKVKSESKTLATITYQNFFGLYKKMSGMSGTVKTEENEFKEIYNLDVIVIPTNKPVKRIDYGDLIYKTKKDKFNAVVKDIIVTNKTGRPVLVGTSSIETSEYLSKKLHELGIKHNLLNAKTKDEEASIVSRAGAYGAITIATNMAGRGTDIKISEAINKLGGLRVIGTERAESKRIDNQLIGRAGRQGNNGSSQFYISITDELLVKNSKKNLKKIYKSVDDSEIRREIFNVQKLISDKNYSSRKDSTKYYDIVNNHRAMIYRERDLVVFGKDIRYTITNMILDVNIKIIDDIATKCRIKNINTISYSQRNKFFRLLIDEFIKKYNYSFEESYEKYNFNRLNSLREIVNFCTDELIDYFNNLIALDIIDFNNNVRKNLLYVIDDNWIKYLTNMELLRQRCKNQSYNQKNPIQVYNKEGGRIYDNLIEAIRSDFIEVLFTVIIPSLIDEYNSQYDII